MVRTAKSAPYLGNVGLLEAKQAYLGQKEDHLASRADHLEEFIRFVKGEIIKSVGK